jgi:hypothetical protein
MIEPVFGPHQVQPRHRPLPAPRTSRRALGMATHNCHPQRPGMKLSRPGPDGDRIRWFPRN